MSDAARPTGAGTPDIESVQDRCRACGHTDTAGKAKTVAVDGDVFKIVVCPECESARWGSDAVRRIAGVTHPEVDP